MLLSLANDMLQIYLICFTNISVILLEANDHNSTMIRDVQNNVCLCFGQKINLAKVQSVFYVDRDDITTSIRSHSLKIDNMNYLGQYLGVPILHKRTNKNTFNYFLDRMNK